MPDVNANQEVRGAGGKFISQEKASNLTSEDLPELVHKSTKMTGALRQIREAEEERKLEQPLVSVSVNNPFSWILKWINKLRKKQTTTITFRLGVPLIALPVLIAAFAGIFFSLGKITTEPEEVSKQQVYKISRAGILKAMNNTSETIFFLILNNGEAIKVVAPENLNMMPLEGKRILAFGDYDSSTNTLNVENIADLEVLPPSSKPVPTIAPTPVATPVPTPAPNENPVTPPPSEEPSI